MTKPKGYNPLRWRCFQEGEQPPSNCYNVKCRPKIEEFAGCFPGNIAMSDVDGITEANGQFLLLEWKDSRVGTSLPTGQRIMFERMTTNPQWTVAVVCGNAETMKVDQLAWVINGKQTKTRPKTLADVQAKFASWAKRAVTLK